MLYRSICKFPFLLFSMALANLIVNCFAAPLPKTIEKNLITFSPTVRMDSSQQSCVGVRVSKDTLLTSTLCAQAIEFSLDEGASIEIMNSLSSALGKVVSISPSKTKLGILGVDDWDYEQSEEFFSFPDFLVSRQNKFQALAFYLEDQGFKNTIVSIHYIGLSNKQNIYGIESNLPLPHGSVVIYQSSLLCIVSYGGLCTGLLLNGYLLARTKREEQFNSTMSALVTTNDVGEEENSSFWWTPGGITLIVVLSIGGGLAVIATPILIAKCCPCDVFDFCLKAVSSGTPEEANRYIRQSEQNVNMIRNYRQQQHHIEQEARINRGYGIWDPR